MATKKEVTMQLVWMCLLVVCCSFSALGQQLELDWAGNITGQTVLNQACQDHQEDILVAGRFSRDTVDFDIGPGQLLFGPVDANHGWHGFLARYSKSSQVIWVNRLVATYRSNVEGVDVDSQGNVYVTGSYSGDFYPDPNDSTLTFYSQPPYQKLFMAKYSPGGNLIWVNSLHSSNAEKIYEIKVLPNGDFIVAGSFWGSMDFDPSNQSHLLTTPDYAYDIFFARYNSNGGLMWVKHLEGPNHDYAQQLAIGPSGEIAITAHFQDSVDLDPGPNTAWIKSTAGKDIYLAKYDSLGNYQWGFGTGSPLGNEGGSDVEFDSLGHVYLTAGIRDSIDFDPSPGTAILSPSGTQAGVLAKYDPIGKYEWAFGIGGATGVISHRQILFPSAGEVAVVGYQQGAVDFDPSQDTMTLVPTSSYQGYLGLYDTSGAFLSAWQTGGPVVAAELLDSNKIITLGLFGWATDFDPSDSTHLLLPSPSSLTQNSYLAQYYLNRYHPQADTQTICFGDSLFLAGAFQTQAGTYVDTFPGPHLDTILTTVLNLAQIRADSSGLLVQLPSCPGVGDGELQLPISGSQGALVYAWSTGDSTAALNSLDTGTYCVTVSDSLGCTLDTCFTLTATSPHCTQLKSIHCGDTLTALDQQVFCEPVVSAVNYEWELTSNTQTLTYLRGSSSTGLVPSVVPGVAYDSTYQVRVRALAGGIWGDLGPVCFLTMPPIPTTQVQTGTCGTTLSSLNSLVFCQAVPGAEDYQWQLIRALDTINYLRGTGNNSLNPSVVPGIAFDSTYQVRVRARAGGHWGSFGALCSLTMPTFPVTQLSAGCGSVMSRLDTLLFAQMVPGATDYEWQWIRGTDTLNYFRGAPNSSINPSVIPGLHYDSTYTVRVRGWLGAVAGTFGSACQVTTPSLPTTQVEAIHCGDTLTVWNGLVFAHAVPAATNYEWEFDDGSGTFTYLRNAPNRTINPSVILGLEAATTYQVRVRAEAGNVWGNYGPVCTLITPISGTPKLAVTEDEYTLNQQGEEKLGTEIQLIPNPTRDEFRIVSDASIREVMITDLFGHQLWQGRVTNSDPLVLSARFWPAGMYLVRVETTTGIAIAKLVRQ